MHEQKNDRKFLALICNDLCSTNRGGGSEQRFANIYSRIYSDRQNAEFGFGGSDSDRCQKMFGIAVSERLFLANPEAPNLS